MGKAKRKSTRSRKSISTQSPLGLNSVSESSGDECDLSPKTRGQKGRKVSRIKRDITSALRLCQVHLGRLLSI